MRASGSSVNQTERKDRDHSMDHQPHLITFPTSTSAYFFPPFLAEGAAATGAKRAWNATIASSSPCHAHTYALSVSHAQPCSRAAAIMPHRRHLVATAAQPLQVVEPPDVSVSLVSVPLQDFHRDVHRHRNYLRSATGAGSGLPASTSCLCAKHSHALCSSCHHLHPACRPLDCPVHG